MDIYGYALQFEKDGEEFYRHSAESVGDKYLADIFIFLAGEEHKHYQIIENLMKGSVARPASAFISDVSNVFSRMRDRSERFTAPKDTVTAVLGKAMRIEDDSIKYYGQAAEQIDEPAARSLLGALKKQEQTHYSLLSSLIEYYETPNLWMEQAEFHNIKDY
jgi:rubrerythrin